MSKIRAGVVLALGLVAANVMADPLTIIGFETGSGVTFQGATAGNYYTLEFAPSAGGPWTNWGSVSSQPMTGAVMALPSPFFYRIQQTDSSAFPPYAPATNIPGSMLADGAIGAGHIGASVSNLFVLKAGDTMTGALNINAGVDNNLVIGSAGAEISIGNAASGGNFGAAIGYHANAFDHGAAIGAGAGGGSYGAGVGYVANGVNYGAAVGDEANGYTYGAAIGHSAYGANYGAAVGHLANGAGLGAAVGEEANGNTYGVAMGYSAQGANYGVAVGHLANGANQNVALGYAASALGVERVAIGHNVNNLVDNSAALRGALYLDGGIGVYYRATFGSGAWNNLLAGYMSGAAVSNSFVLKAGDTMTGALNINAGTSNALVIGSSGPDVAIGSTANGSFSGAAVGYLANGYNGGAAVGREANGGNYGAALGEYANGYDHGVALGNYADGYTNGAAVGFYANGQDRGAALGYHANGYNFGAAVGYRANGRYGAALGQQANGGQYGAAVGVQANCYSRGVAVGYGANGYDYGTAIGNGAVAAGSTRAAIGYNVQCTVDNRTKVLGNLEMTANNGTIFYNGGSKTFVIDHPLDPENKLLRHACLEGPQVWNVYKGTATLDANGEAVVNLPAYFDALNKNPQYMLTPIGAEKMDLFVKQEIQNNSFVISGGVGGAKVCWEISGERNDPAMQASPLVVEEQKAVAGRLFKGK